MKRLHWMLLASLAFTLLFGTCAFADATFSDAWYQDADGTWHIRDKSGQMLRSAWVCDDAVPANGQDVWYLIDADGNMVSNGLVQDLTGNYYSLETQHNGYYGMLRYQSGEYEGIALVLHGQHDGGFARIENQEALDALLARYGLTSFPISNENILYTSALSTAGNESSGTGGSNAGSGSSTGTSALSGTGGNAGSRNSSGSSTSHSASGSSRTSITSLTIDPNASSTGTGIASDVDTEGAVTAIDAPVSLENALAIANAYDPDGIYILRDCLKHGVDLAAYLNEASNAACLDTMVHEGFHNFSFNNGGYNATGGYNAAYYIGDGQTLLVPKTETFYTEEWSRSVPGRLRSLRYDTYVSAGAEPSSNTWGIYGLLNEFTAYAWGMNNQLKLFDYYKTQPFQIETWGAFSTLCENDYLAFAEFRYYILGYLSHAQSERPAIWQGIMENQNFVNTYCIIERQFEKHIADYAARKAEISQMGQKEGKTVQYEKGMIYINGHGMGVGEKNADSRRALLLESSSDALRAQEQELFSRCTASVLPEQTLYVD